MGLFDKKYCDVCGEKIGLLGNRKLEDGNLCKNCAKKLSPWFNERRHSTVDEIKAQLAYREENRQKVSQFHTTRSIGESWKVIFDEGNRWMTVTRSSSPNASENPDIIDFSAITGCLFDINEDKSELFRTTTDGNKESYNPPRYEYTYDFNLVINVNTPWFDEIRIRLNSGTVKYTPQPTATITLFGRSLTDNGVNPENCPEYRKYRDMGQEICDEIDRARGLKKDTAPQTPNVGPAQQPAASGSWICANCGAQNTGRFCESCGTPMPVRAISACTGCGWTPASGESLPRFCPECGKPFRP